MVEIKKDLFDTNASLYVLSCLMRDPLLLQSDKYTLVQTDFYKPLQQLVFSAIFNMAQQGVQNITPADVDLYLKQYESQYEYYRKNKGFEYVNQCYDAAEAADEHKFEIFYTRLKKFSVLRDLESMGVNTDQFYDTQRDALNRDAEDEKLNKISINEILNKVQQGLVTIENRHVGKDQGKSQDAAKGLRDLVGQLKAHPEVGLPLQGNIINYACRGARMGKLYVYSAPSGAGKTRYMVGNACAISMPYIDNHGQVIIRGAKEKPDYQRTLFVTTEQQADEIQTMVLAYVSGVNEKTILLGNYTPDEWERVQKAITIIENFGRNLIIECIPDPSIREVSARLKHYIVTEQVEYIFYDYIFSSPGLLSEFRDVAVREDVALMMLSNTLKEIAATYNVFIQSATQLNDGWSKKEIGLRDQNCIRGSKAIADKIDIGLIGVRINEEEREQIKTLWDELRKGHPEWIHEPNMVVDIYKNRRGELNGVKVFRWFDHATLHCEDLFVTDASYKPIPKDKKGDLNYDISVCDFLELKLQEVK